MSRYTVAVLVKNQFGVLNRITNMFRRRQFNIATINASETETAELSRITVSFDGEELYKQQLINQLYKLPDVCSIKEITPDNSVSCELLLIKMENSASSRADIESAAKAFGAKTIDYSQNSLVLRIVDTSLRIDDFINLMRNYKILEICRTGSVSLEKGNKTIRQTINL